MLPKWHESVWRHAVWCPMTACVTRASKVTNPRLARHTGISYILQLWSNTRNCKTAPRGFIPEIDNYISILSTAMPRRMRGAKTQMLAVLRRCTGTATCGSDPGRYADTTSSLLFVNSPAQGGGAKISGAVKAWWKKMFRGEKKCHYKVANRREKNVPRKMNRIAA